MPNRSENKRLTAALSPAHVWAFAVGTSVGWGSLVVTANTYLAQSGPLGSVPGLIVGMAVMLVISRNYAYLMNAYPEAGGAYAYLREVFGYDHGFLTAWFLALTYLAILWGILGFLAFRLILRRDRSKRFGKSIVVWAVLLGLVLLISLIWMRRSMANSNRHMLEDIRKYYVQVGDVNEERAADERFIEEQVDDLEAADTKSILMATGMFAFAMLIMATNYSYMNKRAKESERIANTDPMTGVKSKHAYMVRELELNGEIADGIAGEFGVVVCDVNGLKHINDTYGHKAGDKYIRDACALVCELFQHSPVYRVGGDEFVVILSGRDFDRRGDILADLQRRSEGNIGTDNVVISAGVSDYRPGEDMEVHTVFHRADERMYENKQALKAMGARTR